MRSSADFFSTSSLDESVAAAGTLADDAPTPDAIAFNRLDGNFLGLLPPGIGGRDGPFGAVLGGPDFWATTGVGFLATTGEAGLGLVPGGGGRPPEGFLGATPGADGLLGFAVVDGDGFEFIEGATFLGGPGRLGYWSVSCDTGIWSTFALGGGGALAFFR